MEGFEATDIVGKLAQATSSEVFVWGEEILEDDLVQLVQRGRYQLNFNITHLNERVGIYWGEDKGGPFVIFYCSCEGEKNHSSCAHIWACSLKADEYDLLSTVDVDSDILFEFDVKKTSLFRRRTILISSPGG